MQFFVRKIWSWISNPVREPTVGTSQELPEFSEEVWLLKKCFMVIYERVKRKIFGFPFKLWLIYQIIFRVRPCLTFLSIEQKLASTISRTGKKTSDNYFNSPKSPTIIIIHYMQATWCFNTCTSSKKLEFFLFCLHRCQDLRSVFKSKKWIEMKCKFINDDFFHPRLPNHLQPSCRLEICLSRWHVFDIIFYTTWISFLNLLLIQRKKLVNWKQFLQIINCYWSILCLSFLLNRIVKL